MSATIEREAATKPPLEPEAQAFADATANPSFLYDLGPEKGREVVRPRPARSRSPTSPTSG
jgi:hypothetical protein